MLVARRNGRAGLSWVKGRSLPWTPVAASAAAAAAAAAATAAAAAAAVAAATTTATLTDAERRAVAWPGGRQPGTAEVCRKKITLILCNLTDGHYMAAVKILIEKTELIHVEIHIRTT